MTYKLNTLGWETIRNFVRNNADYNKCMGEYFVDAEKAANLGILDLWDGVAAVWLSPEHQVHRYEVVLILRQEHYDNV